MLIRDILASSFAGYFCSRYADISTLTEFFCITLKTCATNVVRLKVLGPVTNFRGCYFETFGRSARAIY